MPDSRENRLCRIQRAIELQAVEGIGHVYARRLWEHLGPLEHWKEVDFTMVQHKQSHTWHNHLIKLERQGYANRQLEILHQYKWQVVLIDDKEYPPYLRHLVDAPLLLFVKGNRLQLLRQHIAIVGTRKPSKEGLLVCEQIVHSIASSEYKNGWSVVSGLARGVDAQAHKTAISELICTLAILGNPPQHIYPPEHLGLAEDIVSNEGLLVTEFLPDVISRPYHFAQRNRVIGGMARLTIVIESALKGGALITARRAYEENRDVFAVPGRCSDTSSLGCNRLIAQNIAQLIEDPKTFWSSYVSCIQYGKTEGMSSLSVEAQAVLDYIAQCGKVSLEALVNMFGNQFPVCETLLELETSRIVSFQKGGYYSLYGPKTSFT